MIPVTSLWLPILLAAVVVFIISSVIHMVLGYHRTDFAKAPGEDEVLAALGAAGIPPGEYVMPYAGSPAAMKDPAWLEKVRRGPVAFMSVMPGGDPKMGAQLAQWFLYCVLVGVFAAYVAGRAVPAGGDYLSVFRFVGTTAFAGYGLALIQNSIWYKRRWSTTLKNLFDALVYSLATAGIFGTFWP